MSKKLCRPATSEDLKALIKSLNEHDVEYLLVGGYALFAHGYSRATEDIDLLVRATEESGQRIKNALLVLPDGAARDLEPRWFEEGENIRVADEIIVDLLVTANGETYETLAQYSETTYLDEIPVKTVNLPGLLLTKQTSREKDVADREVLVRAIDALAREDAKSNLPLQSPGLGASPLGGPFKSAPDEPKPLWRRIFKR